MANHGFFVPSLFRGVLNILRVGSTRGFASGTISRMDCTMILAVIAPATMVVGNSLPVRDMDRFGGIRPDLTVLGNRGASGIDGLVSTTLGVAAAAGGGVGIMGDLSFLHDLNGLFAARDLDVPVLLVVMNNDGGGIFDLLPVRDLEPTFTRRIVVPHGLDLAHAAALFEVGYHRLACDQDVRSAVREAMTAPGCTILDITSDRRHNRERREVAAREAHAAARKALEDTR